MCHHKQDKTILLAGLGRSSSWDGQSCQLWCSKLPQGTGTSWGLALLCSELSPWLSLGLPDPQMVTLLCHGCQNWTRILSSVLVMSPR